MVANNHFSTLPLSHLCLNIWWLIVSFYQCPLSLGGKKTVLHHIKNGKSSITSLRIWSPRWVPPTPLCRSRSELPTSHLRTVCRRDQRKNIPKSGLKMVYWTKWDQNETRKSQKREVALAQNLSFFWQNLWPLYFTFVFLYFSVCLCAWVVSFSTCASWRLLWSSIPLTRDYFSSLYFCISALVSVSLCRGYIFALYLYVWLRTASWRLLWSIPLNREATFPLRRHLVKSLLCAPRSCNWTLKFQLWRDFCRTPPWNAFHRVGQYFWEFTLS